MVVVGVCIFAEGMGPAGRFRLQGVKRGKIKCRACRTEKKRMLKRVKGRMCVRGGEGVVGIGDGDGGLYLFLVEASPPSPVTMAVRHSASPDDQGIDAIDDATPPSRGPFSASRTLRRRAKPPVFLSQGDHTRASMWCSEASGRKLGIAGAAGMWFFSSSRLRHAALMPRLPLETGFLLGAHCHGRRGCLDRRNMRTREKNNGAVVRGVLTPRGRIAARGARRIVWDVQGQGDAVEESRSRVVAWWWWRR